MIPIPYRLIIKEPSVPYRLKDFQDGYMWQGLLLDSGNVGPHWQVMKDVTGTVMVVFSEGGRN